MRSISELKKSARNSLNGYWGTVAISYLIYFLISFVTGCIPIINLISSIVIIPALAIGLNYQAFNLSLGNEISIKDMFTDSKKMVKSILFNLLLSICLILLTIFVVVIFVISLLISEVIITKQKYKIISLNKKIEQTKTLEEELKMDKAQLLSKSRLRSLAIDKLKMIKVENLDESIKNQISE